MICKHAVTVKIFGEVNVPIWLEKIALAVISIGVADGCGTKSTTDLLTVTDAVPVPITPFASLYVTVTGTVMFIVTLA